MKVDLTIETSYLPDWGIWEGVRELIQNGKDAESEFGAPLKISHENGVLRISNIGVVLPYKALLVGYTSKAGKANLIGQFGEGLKFGTLALVRAGRSVKIRTGSEVWIPNLAWSSKFGAEVLCIDIQGGRKERNRVSIEVEVTEDEWTEYRTRFGFLGTISDADRVTTPRGDLLLGGALKGRLYVKGIFVNTDKELAFGYDYHDATVDRDRKMVADWDKKWENACIWRDAVNVEPELFDAFFELLRKGAPDLAGLDHYSVPSMSNTVADKVVARFEQDFGKDAVPVENIEQSMQIEHLGKKGVIVSKALRAVIEHRRGGIDEVRKGLEEEAVRHFSWSELELEEKRNLLFATGLIDKATASDFGDMPSVLGAITVVEFRSDSLAGQFRLNPPKIYIARRVLANLDNTLATIIHEMAHVNGADGAHGHVSLMEQLWMGVTRVLLNRKEVDDAKFRAGLSAGLEG